MSILKLRPYQQNLVDGIADAWVRARSVIAVLPTAGGKTVCFSRIMHEHIGCSAAVVHRKEIVGQISLTLAMLEVPHRIIAPSAVVTAIRRRHLKQLGRSWVDPDAPAGVVSVQTLTSRGAAKNRELQRWVAQITLAVFDEGHHYIKSGFWAKAVKMLDRAKLLFLTATPLRLDGKGLGAWADGFAEALVEGPPVQELINEGYASPFRYLAPDTDLNLENIPLTASGELDVKELRKRVNESHFVGSVVEHYKTHTPGKQAIVFAADVATAEEIAAAFRQEGITAEAVSGKTDGRVRDRAVSRFSDCEIRVLPNVDLFDEGFDVPGAEVAILARPTESLAKFLQMVGRVLRPVYAADHDLSTADRRRKAIAAGGKPHAVILDAVRNWERHGMPNWPRKWSLESRIKGQGKREGLLLRICAACTQPYERHLKVCPYCGSPWEPAERQQIQQVDGDLKELDPDMLEAIFERIRRANMPPEEYGVDQIERRIPPIGRGADMKRHKANLYRREVLRNLIAWWIGLQPSDRPLDEKHRRFYLRFGCDIGTAHTLKADETDALINTIAENFNADL